MDKFLNNTINSLITMRTGEMLQIITETSDKKYRFSSNDTCLLSALQNGKLVANSTGFTSVYVYHGDELLTEIFVDIYPGERIVPILYNRYNKVTHPTGTIGILKKDYVESDKTIYLSNTAKDSFYKLCDAARKNNVVIYAKNGYRSVKQQQKIINYYIERDGYEAAIKRCAPPCYSEHHSGLALDISGGKLVDGKFVADVDIAYKWIADNAYKFGFMIKNPQGKEEITGSIYEPWHIRYTGDTKLSKVLHDEKLTLDEYIDKTVQVTKKLNLTELLNGSFSVQSIAQPANNKAQSEPETQIETVAESTEQEPRRETITIKAFGDIVPGDAECSSEKYEAYFRKLETQLKNADCAIFGLSFENDSTDVEQIGRERRALQAAAEKTGQNIIFAEKGSVFGKALNVADIYELKGKKIALLKITVTEDYNNGKSGIISLQSLKADMCRLGEEIKSLKLQGAEYIICYFHWGDRYSEFSNVIQRYISAYTSVMGVDLIMGSGSGNVQEHRSLKIPNDDDSYDVEVFYGLGNSLPFETEASDIDSGSGAVLEIKLDGGKLQKVEAIPLYAADGNVLLNLYTPHTDAEKKADKNIRNIFSNSQPVNMYPRIREINAGQYIKIAGDLLPNLEYDKYRSDDAIKASVTDSGFLISNSSGYVGITAYEINGQGHSCIVHVIECEESSLPVLVNINNPIRDDYIPDSLVSGAEYHLKNNVFLKFEVAKAWSNMYEAAKEEGIIITCFNGFRTRKQQRDRIKKYSEKYGRKSAVRRYMPVGCSEHHLGTALDAGGGNNTDGQSSNSAAVEWIWENAHRFGFIHRKTSLNPSQVAYAHLRYAPEVCYFSENKSIEEALESMIT